MREFLIERHIQSRGLITPHLLFGHFLIFDAMRSCFYARSTQAGSTQGTRANYFSRVLSTKVPVAAGGIIFLVSRQRTMFLVTFISQQSAVRSFPQVQGCECVLYRILGRPSTRIRLKVNFSQIESLQLERCTPPQVPLL